MNRVLFFALFFCSLKCFSQSQFSDAYPFPSIMGEYPLQMTPTHDNGLAGISRVLGDTVFRVFRFDSTQQNLWVKQFKIPGKFLVPGDIIELANHDFLLTGSFNSIGGTIRTYFLLRIDSSGSLLSANMDSDSSYSSLSGNPMRMAGKTQDGGIIFSQSRYVDSLQNGFTFITKIDSAGNILWTTCFQPDTGAFFNDGVATKISDQNIVITGFFHYNSNFTNQTFFSILKFDSAGSLLWSKRSPLINHSTSACNPIEKNGSYYVHAQSDTPTAIANVPHVYKVSATNGDLEWHAYYDFWTGYVWYNTATKTHDDRIVLTARKDTIYAGGADGFPICVEIDTSGSIAASEIYGWYSPHNIEIINTVETVSGNLVLFGLDYDWSTQINSYILLDVDSTYYMSCNSSPINLRPPVYMQDTLISSGTAFSVSTSLIDITSYVQSTSFTLSNFDYCSFIDVVQKKNEDLPELFPNPSEGNFTIRLDKVYPKVVLRILSVTGQQISEETFASVNAINFTINLTPGIYIAEIKMEEGKLQRLKLVKE